MHHYYLNLSPFRFAIHTNNPKVFSKLQDIYPPSVMSDKDSGEFIDFDIDFFEQGLFRKHFDFRCANRQFRQCEFDNLVSTIEWGLNWTLSSFQNYYLCIHAAVLERQGVTVVLPAPPGSGKSTLCSLLMLSGWRLLSDEHCLVDLKSHHIVPAVRPIAIKNKSFSVISRWFPSATLLAVQSNTLKGSVGYLAPTEHSWQHRLTVAKPGFVVLPSYRRDDIPTEFIDVPKSEMTLELIKNSFNYQTLGKLGFDALTGLVESSQCKKLTYHHTHEALALFEGLLNV